MQISSRFTIAILNTYAAINLSEALCPESISDQSICINGDIAEILTELKEHLRTN